MLLFNVQNYKELLTRLSYFLFSFIGKGIISCPPPKVWEVLKEPENTYHYNNILKVKLL